METAAYREQAQVEGQHWWFSARRAILRHVTASLGIAQGGTLVEIGSGTGANVAWLRDFGSVIAVKPSPTARAYSIERNPGIPHYKDLNQLEATRQIDAAFALDVLEHIEDPRPTLRALAEHMPVGAPLLVTVPAHAFLYGPHDRYLHHVRRYSRSLLVKHLHEGGFELEFLSPMNCLLFLVAVVSRMLERLGKTKREGAQGTSLPPAPLNTALRRLFAIERYWVPRRRLPWGLSWIAIARRSESSKD